MKIGFFCDRGEIPEIGTGHFYRSKWTSESMQRRGHEIINIMPGCYLPNNLDALVIDDLRSQRKLADEAKSNGTKVVLIDGIEEDVMIADLTISSCFNPASQYKGVEYMSFLPRGHREYVPSIHASVFVSMGGYDANNIAYTVIDVLKDMGIDAVVTKSINHGDLAAPGIDVYVGEDYYEPMERCKIGIVNGGLTMFQALHYGLPSLVVPQYDHQLEYVEMVKNGCIVVKHTKDDIQKNINKLLHDADLRRTLSETAQSLVDGRAIERTCDLIEGILWTKKIL